MKERYGCIIISFDRRFYLGEFDDADARAQLAYIQSFANMAPVLDKIVSVVDQLNPKLRIVALTDALMEKYHPQSKRYGIDVEFDTYADYLYYKMATSEAYSDAEKESKKQ